MNYTRHQGNSITLERPVSQNYPLASYGSPGDRMLVAIDPRVEDALSLAAGVQLGAEVLILDSNRDGVEQITQALQGRTDISSLHLISHGSPGCLELGSTQLSLDTLDRYISQLQTWSNSIRGGSLLLYGCRVASGETGSTFLQRLHQITGANIAASNQRVGNAASGGSWELETRIGQITSGLAFLPEVTQAYAGVFPTPQVSLQTISGTFDESDNIVADALVKSVESGASLLTFSFSLNEPPPEQGVTVTVNSDIAGSLADYFTDLGSPFSSGGEVIEAVYDPETGRATGFRFRIDEPNAVLNLNVGGAENVPEQVSFFLEDGVGYTVNEDASDATVNFYETLAQVPEPTVLPEVGFTVSDNTLVESGGSETTLTFYLSEPPPQDGVLVYVNSNVEGALAEFDVLNAEIEGGVFPAPNFASSGFFFKILDTTASITLPAFSDDVTEGREGLTFSLQEGPGYTIAPQASEATLTVADTPNSEIQVDYEVEPNTLIEGRGTESVHTFSLSAPPPAEGVTVNVTAPLGEFDVSAAEVTGGTIAEVNDDGFAFTITEQTGTINVPVLNDGEAEGLEELTFSLEPGNGYQVNPDTSEATLNAVDNRRQVPPPTTASEPNDTLSKALDTRLSSLYPTFSITSSINYDSDNNPQVDATEDVDFYSFNVNAGDTVTIDVDGSQLQYPLESELDSILRLLNSEGTELALSDDSPAPDEIFVSDVDSYIEFTAEETGTYYVGVSSYNNIEYEPSNAGSGSGSSSGEYDLTINLVTEEPVVNGTGTSTTLNDDASDAGDVTVTNQDGGASDVPTVSLQTITGRYDESGSILTPALVESVDSGSSILTFILNAEGPIPLGGVEVIINSDTDITEWGATNTSYGNNLAYQPFSPGGEVLGAVYDATGQATGIRFRLDQANAIINIPILNDEQAEAPQQGNFFLEPSEGYTINADAGSSTVNFYDTLEQVPAPTVVPEVSFEISNTTLVESEGSSTTINFSLSEPPPEEGVLVYVNSGDFDAIAEFDVFAAQVTGGVFPAPDNTASGFYFKILEQTASITLPVFPSSVIEGIEEYTYTLETGPGYTVNSEANSATITIADTPNSQVQIGDEAEDTPEQVSSTFASEPNDTIPEAIDTELSSNNRNFSISGAIDSDENNEEVDASEDVDFYKFALKAGDTVNIDVDANQFSSELFSELRLFDAEGTELAQNNFTPAPDELLVSGFDSYLEFTAEEAGTYYLGVSLLENLNYDPFTAGSGTGAIFPDFGINTGEYDLDISLIPRGSGV